MAAIARAVVLSDIHLGPGNALTTFRDDRALATLLADLAAPSTAPTELILAGDCFDFLQVDGYDGFDAAKAPERFDAILRGPKTVTVMTALRRFAARPDHAITVLSGNHDPELVLPDVRRRFESAIDRAEGGVLYADDTPLWPAKGHAPAVWGRALGDERAAVWVVHGDRWDPANIIDRDALRRAAQLGQPFKLPAGSHLVFEVLQKIKPEHAWVDELKPEMDAVLPLLLYIAPDLIGSFLQNHYGLGTRLLRSRIEAQIKTGPLFGDAPTVPAAPDIPGALADLLAAGLRDEPIATQARLLDEIEARLRSEPLPAPGTLDVQEIQRFLLGRWLSQVRDADRFQDIDGPDAIHDAVGRYLPTGVTALIAGHTHGPRARPDLRPAYFNAGTWIPVGKIPAGHVGDLQELLEHGPSWPAEAPRTFVHVELEDVPEVRLFACDEDGTPREIGQ
jgi:UDP-2,3-diacylglucosamine pyrophosphatase LpxH